MTQYVVSIAKRDFEVDTAVSVYGPFQKKATAQKFRDALGAAIDAHQQEWGGWTKTTDYGQVVISCRALLAPSVSDASTEVATFFEAVSG